MLSNLIVFVSYKDDIKNQIYDRHNNWYTFPKSETYTALNSIWCWFM